MAVPAVVTDPQTGKTIVISALERDRIAIEKEIQQACNEFLSEPDWNKNMGIVDKLNNSPYLCPFAIKEIRKQLKTKNPEIEILALQLVETVIKNCPSSHAAVAQADFMRYLVKVGTDQRQGGKWTQFASKMKKKKKAINSLHVRSQCIEKALLILKMLAIAYEESHLYPVFKMTYKQLLAQKIRFPETNKDESLNIFSPLQSSQYAIDSGGINGGVPIDGGDDFVVIPTAMGSVQNPSLPMIRPLIPVENVTHSLLVQAQEQCQLFYSIINAPVLTFELVPDLTTMLNNTQQQIVAMISEGTAAESALMQALQVNDVINQVIEDGQSILNGTKRRYQEVVDVAKLMAEDSIAPDDEQKSDDDEEDGDDIHEPSLEHSISIGDNGKNEALFAISKPKKTGHQKQKSSKRLSALHKKQQQSEDLLGLAIVNKPNNHQPKKKESDDDLLGFLAMNDAKNMNMNNMSNTEQAAPQPAFAPPDYMNNNHMNMNGNGNVFRENNIHAMGNQNNTQNMNMNMNNGNKNGAMAQMKKRKSSIELGNSSVLNVLTGTDSDVKGKENNNNNNNKKAVVAQNNNNNANADPFGGLSDPFADMNSSFAQVMGDNNNNNNNNNNMKKVEQKQKGVANDPFGDLPTSSLFEQNDQNKNYANPKIESKATVPQKKILKPQTLHPMKQNSDDVILDMFQAGASPDPNSPRTEKEKPQKVEAKKENDANPFDSLANPFGGSMDDVGKDNKNEANNPFADLDDPFADNMGMDENNPFAASNKKDEFMADRDPFAGIM